MPSRTSHSYESGSRRGFAAMDPEQRREIASRGGRASHGGRGYDYDERDREPSRGREEYGGNYSQGRRAEYDEDDERYSTGSRRGFAAMDPDERREIASRGGQASHGSRGRDYEEDRGDNRGRRSDEDDRYYSRGREEDDYENRGPGSRRGFASMDPERQREIASEGGRASGGFSRWDRDDLREVASRGGRASGGFARWDPEDLREVAARGGRASHGGHYEDEERPSQRERDYEDDERSSGGSRRGFASWSPEDRREVASRGGRSSHRYD